MKYYRKVHVKGPIWIKVYADDNMGTVYQFPMLGKFRFLTWRIVYNSKRGLDYRTILHERQHAIDFLNPLTWFECRLSFRKRHLYKEARCVVAESYYGVVTPNISYQRARSAVIAVTTKNNRTVAARMVMRQNKEMGTVPALKWKD